MSFRNAMRHGLLLLAVIGGAMLPAAQAATIIVVNNDGAGEGFNDPAPVAPVGGNTATTLGAQRLVAFQRAADIWGARLAGSVAIRVRAQFDPLTCSANSAILGSAGPISVFRDFAGAPVAATYYPSALANTLRGLDLDPSSDDISATFNSSIGTTCPFPNTWYYGLDGTPPGNQIDFVTVLLHELGHGLGFLTLVNLTTGAKFAGANDAYMLHLEHHGAAPADYPSMSDAQRLTASTATGNLHWTGSNVRAAAGVLSAGAVGDHVRMYAPNPAQPGSSVSHFDTALTPNQLMEPSYTVPLQTPVLELPLYQDIGWSLTSSPALTVSPSGGLTSAGVVGGPFSPASQTFTLQNSGSSAINWTATSSNTTVATVSAPSGSLAGGASTTVTTDIAAGAAALAAGSYAATITFTNTTNGNGNTTRPVSLAITSSPALTVSPSGGLTSAGVVGGPFSPASQTFTLQNSGSSAINWTATSSNTTVATVSAPSGSLAGGASTTVTTDIAAGAAALAAGSYASTITFTNTTNGNGNTTRPVSLAITSSPALTVSPSGGLTSAGVVGGPFSPASQTFTLQNSGSSAINWTATSSNTTVATVSAPSGSLAGGASTTVTTDIAAGAAALAAGSYASTITFTNTTNGNGNTTRLVSLAITPVTAGRANDNFANATIISGVSGSVSGNNATASREAGEPLHFTGTSGTSSLWWRWTAPATGQATFATNGSAFDTVTAVYAGSSLTGLTQIMSNDNASTGLQSRLSFHALAGMEYSIAVDGYGAANTGSVSLSWSFTASQGPTGLVAAILPYARSVSTGTIATAFATIANATGAPATGCSLQMPGNQGLPGLFQYQTASPANVLTGSVNTTVDIPAGGFQQFVFGYTPSASLAATDIRLVFDCENTAPVETIVGVNTFLLSSSSTPAPDMVAIGATVGNDGIMNVPPAGGFFAAAAVNIGAADLITATIDTGSASLPLSIAICQSDPTGACLAPPSASVGVTVATNEVVTFSIFASASGAIPFSAATNRVYLRLASGGVVRGATSVAVRTTASDHKVAGGQ